MSNQQNNNNQEDYVRPPDKIVRERLTNSFYNNGYKEDDYLQQCIMQSLLEQQGMQEANELYEKRILQEHQQEIEKQIVERKEKFSPFLINLIKLKTYDNDFQKVFEILSPMIENYCQDINSVVPLDSNIREFVLKKIKTMREHKNVVELLLSE